MSHNEQGFARQLRELGYRVTPQRQLILDTLCDMGGHATINQIFAKVHAQAPAIDKATVYRSVQLFQEHDFVLSANINGQTVYEIADSHPHHHLVCDHCQHVVALSDHHFDALARHLSEEHGFLARMNHITINGICAQCQQELGEVDLFAMQ